MSVTGAATSTAPSGSSRGGGGASSSSSSTSSGSAADILVLLDGCSLMWGEALMLKPELSMLRNLLGLAQHTLLTRELASILHNQQQQQRQQPPPSVMASASAQGPLESNYKPLVTMLLPALLHMRAQGMTGEAMDTANVWFLELKRSLTSCVGKLVAMVGWPDSI
jgi:hypothetical protein